MKRVLLFILLISFIGYSQNPIQTNHPSFNDGLPQSFQSEMIVENSDYTLRLDKTEYINISGHGWSGFYEYTYDENSNTTLYVQNQYDSSTQSFYPFYKEEHVFNDNGDESLSLYYEWDYTLNTLIPSYKEEHNYDFGGNRILYQKLIWDITTQSYTEKEDSYKYEYTYDEEGNRKSLINYNWDYDSYSLIPHELTEYDNDSKKTTKQYYWDYENGIFHINPHYKSESNYDEDGNIVNSLDYTISQTYNLLTPSGITKYYYDSLSRVILVEFISGCDSSTNLNGKIDYTYENGTRRVTELNSFKRIEEFDEDERLTHYEIYGYYSNILYPISKWESDYDLNGNRILFINYKVNSDNQSFEYLSKSEYTYDENGNQTLKMGFDWDSSTQSFKRVDKIEFTYDSNNLKTNQTTYIWDLSLNNFRPTIKMDISTISETDTNLVREGIISEYDTNSNTWNELEGEEFKSYWYYTKTQSLSTNSVELNSFSIYPNPTSNSLHINSSEYLKTPIFELYDVKGSKILSNPFKLTEPIDVSGLQPSMYIYNVKDGSVVKQSGKIIKE
jgi:hypothetical protein